jgi:hypothetical protein
MSEILRFLEGSGSDLAGRTISEIFAFGPGDLETHHDFIQWLFPLAEPSSAVPDSPVLSHFDIVSIKSSPLAQRNLLQASEPMSAFYRGTEHWMTPSDHNHLRITRIIKSLRLLVGSSAATSFRDRILDSIERSHAPINQKSRGLWMKA